MMGLYYSKIFNTTAQFNYRPSRHTKQYLSEQSFYSSLTTPRGAPATRLSHASFSTQLKTAISSSLSHCLLTLP
jgi:hypothetical protein